MSKIPNMIMKIQDFICKSNWRMFLFLVVLSLCAFGYNLHTPFKTIDDYDSIVQNPIIKNLSNIKTIFTSSFFGDGTSYYYRPMVSLAFMIEYKFFGLDSFFYNLTNILLHGSNAFLVFMIINSFQKDRKFSLWVSSLFVVHPIQWETVMNIPGRSNLLSGFFVLAGFLFLIKSDQSKKLFSFIFSWILFTLGLLSKESAIVFPLITLAYYIFLEPTKSFKNKTIVVILFLSTVFLYLMLRNSLGIVSTFGIYQGITWQDFVLRFVTFLKGMLIYFSLMTFPKEFYFDRTLIIIESFSQLGFWLICFVWIGLILTFIVRRKKISKTIWFFISWMFIHVLTVSQIIPLALSHQRIFLAEHFFYLSSISVIVFIIIGFKQAWIYLVSINSSYLRSLKIVFICYLAFILIMTYQQNLFAKNQIMMFQHSLKENPDNYRTRTGLAFSYFLNGRLNEAEREFNKVLILKPEDIISQSSLATIYCNQGKYWDCIEKYEHIKQLPGYSLNIQLKDTVEKNLIFANIDLIREYEKQNQVQLNNFEALYHVGLAYAQKNEFNKSIEALSLAVKLNPGYVPALFKLGELYEMTQNYPKALENYEKLIIINPQDGHVILVKKSIERLKQKIIY